MGEGVNKVRRKLPFPIFIFYGMYILLVYLITRWTNVNIVWVANIVGKNISSAWLASLGLNILFGAKVTVPANMCISIAKLFF